MSGDLDPYREPLGWVRVVVGVASLAVAAFLGLLTLRELVDRYVDRVPSGPAPPPAGDLDGAPVLHIDVDDAEEGALRRQSGDGVEAGSPQSFVWRTWTSDSRSSADLLVDAVHSARDRGGRFHRVTCGRSGSLMVLGTQVLDGGPTVAVEVMAVDVSAPSGEITLRVSAGSSPTIGGGSPGGDMEVGGECPADLVERISG